MSEILRYLLQEQQKENIELKKLNRNFFQAAKNIADKYVSPEYYPFAMEEIEKVFHEQIQGHKQIS